MSLPSKTGGSLPSGGASIISTPAMFHVTTDGSDETGDGSPSKPYLTAQKGYEMAMAYIIATGSGACINFGVGTWYGIVAATTTTPSQLSIIGAGYGVSHVGGITAHGQTLGVHSDRSVDLGTIDLSGEVGSNGASGFNGGSGQAGGTAYLVGCVFQSMSLDGGGGGQGGEGWAGADTTGQGGTGGQGGDGGNGGDGGTAGFFQLLNCMQLDGCSISVNAGQPGSGGGGGLGGPGDDGNGPDGNSGVMGSPGTTSSSQCQAYTSQLQTISFGDAGGTLNLAQTLYKTITSGTPSDLGGSFEFNGNLLPGT